MRPTVSFDIAVVGAGMIGCAAAKYLAQTGDVTVVLIGPEEPENRQKADIFSSHYDDGRIVRVTDGDPVWAYLAKQSIAKYKEIERISGIHFYSEVGCLAVGSEQGPYLKTNKETALKYKTKNQRLSKDAVGNLFPFLKLFDGCECILASSNSGFINPRKLVKAQKQLAKSAGCYVINDVVKQIIPINLPTKGVLLRTDNGFVCRSNVVLLATGGFTTCRMLLPARLNAKPPNVFIKPRTIIKVQISATEAARLKSMPSVIVKDDDPKKSDENQINRSCYIVPPLQDVKGNFIIKVGSGLLKLEDSVELLHKPQDITYWCRSHGDSRVADQLLKILLTYIPDLRVESVESDSCLVVDTVSGYPYVDMLNDRMGVAIGGNGLAAKSSDELGKMAALMVAKGKWMYPDLPGDYFRYKPVEKNFQSSAKL